MDRPLRPLPFDTSVLELVPAAVYAVHADGTIAYFNRQAEELWGQTPELGCRRWRWCGALEVFEADGRPIDKEQCLVVDVLRTGRTVKDYPMTVERPDGSRIHVRASVGPVRDAGGAIVGAINTFRDVTEHRQREEALRQAVAAAEAANQAKDRFLAMLSHELRTPLAPVVMTLAAMEGRPGLPADLKADVSMVRRNIDLETKLIDDLLDLSRVAAGKLALDPRPVRVHDLLQHVIASGRSDAHGKRLRVETHFAAANDRVVADPARLQQVFWNLFRNATKFTPAGGTLRVRTADDARDGRLVIEFADTGVGIRPEQVAKIFDAFEQGDQRAAGGGGGLGLGLAIAKAVVELHGGTIAARSDGPGRGATFTVSLDADGAAHAAEDGPAAVDPAVPAGARRRVLIVEDHPDTATVIARLLAGSGYEVATADTVAKALAAAAEQPFDVVVSDIGLPDASGYELMAALRGRHGLKGIALSGYGMEEDVRQGREAGFHAHVTKPVDLDRLMAVIEQVTTA